MQPQHIAAARTLSEEQYTVAAVHRVAVVVRRVAYQVRTNSSAAQSKHEARIIYIYIYNRTIPAQNGSSSTTPAHGVNARMVRSGTGSPLLLAYSRTKSADLSADLSADPPTQQIPPPCRSLSTNTSNISRTAQHQHTAVAPQHRYIRVSTATAVRTKKTAATSADPFNRSSRTSLSPADPQLVPLRGQISPSSPTLDP